MYVWWNFHRIIEEVELLTPEANKLKLFVTECRSLENLNFCLYIFLLCLCSHVAVSVSSMHKFNICFLWKIITILIKSLIWKNLIAQCSSFGDCRIEQEKLNIKNKNLEWKKNDFYMGLIIRSKHLTNMK